MKNSLIAIATVTRFIEQSEEPSQFIVHNLPENTNQNLMDAIVKISIGNDEFDMHKHNDEAFLSDLNKAYASCAHGVYDRHDYHYGFERYEILSSDELDALEKIKSKLICYEICADEVLQDLFEFLVAHKDSLHELNTVHPQFHEAAIEYTPLQAIEKTNQTVATLLKAFVGYIEEGIEDWGAVVNPFEILTAA